MTVKRLPPDGGWGWVIVLGSSMINLSTRAIEPSFGLLFGDLLRDLDVATTGASVIISTLDAIINFSGLFVGPLIKRFTYRKVAVAGALLSSTALFLTAYADSMVHLITTFSVIGGVGFGLATSSTLVGINSYFSKRKGQAVGLAMAGTAFGFMSMPQIVSFLLNEYDFRSTMLILSAMSLHAVVGAFLFQPVKWHLRSVVPVDELILNPAESEEAQVKLLTPERKFSIHTIHPTETKRLSRQFSGPALTTNIHVNNDLPGYASAPVLIRRKTSVISNVSLVDLTGSSVHIDIGNNIAEENEDEDDLGLEINVPGTEQDMKANIDDYKNEKNLEKNPEKNETKKKFEEPVGCWAKFCRLFDLNLLKDGVYLNILYGLSISMVAEMNFKLIIPFFLGNLGFSKSEIAMSLSLMAVADITARVLIPPILDRVSYPKRITLMIGSVLVALCRSLLAEQTKPISLMVILIIHGFFRGMTLINNPLVLSEYASGENFPAVLGLSMVAKGIFIVVLGPLCGYIRDKTQSFPMYIHFQSLMILSMVVAWSIELIIRHRREKRAQSIIPSINK